MSFKAIQAMFINEESRKIATEIDTANKHLGKQTRNFEKELRVMEQAQKKAAEEEKMAIDAEMNQVSMVTAPVQRAVN